MPSVFTFSDLKIFFAERNYKTIIVGDAEPVVHRESQGEIFPEIRPGGVSIALEPIARASGGIFIARGRTEADKKVVNSAGKVKIDTPDGNSYILKRLFVPEDESDPYYNGYANQTLWPLCHIAFQRPEFRPSWYEGYAKVNKRFAQAIREEIKGKTIVWLNDYQLCLVPSFLEKSKDTMLGMFWHIPWPTWEIFRILPEKKQLLESFLKCDFIAFHRGYHVRNFLETVERELEVRIDHETNQIHYNRHITTVDHLPMGIDTDVIKSLYTPAQKESLIRTILRHILGKNAEKSGIESYFKQYKVILGIDRLDYTKGIPARLAAIDRFFTLYPQYIGKLIYLSILAPSREKIPSYQQLKKDVLAIAEEINNKYARHNWKPIQFIFATFPRSELINFYSKADLCLITPLDDGMNLVSKEFVIASSMSQDPGMLVLSQFAGSAIDLTSSLIVNPYNTEEVARAIKIGFEMTKKDKISRTKAMVDILDERNIYEWGYQFLKETELASRVNAK